MSGVVPREGADGTEAETAPALEVGANRFVEAVGPPRGGAIEAACALPPAFAATISAHLTELPTGEPEADKLFDEDACDKSATPVSAVIGAVAS